MNCNKTPKYLEGEGIGRWDKDLFQDGVVQGAQDSDHAFLSTTGQGLEVASAQFDLILLPSDRLVHPTFVPNVPTPSAMLGSLEEEDVLGLPLSLHAICQSPAQECG